MDIERQIVLAGDDIILIFMGLLVCLLGYLVWVKQNLTLLAGKKEKFIKDKKGLSGFMGKWLVAIGVITMLMPICMIIFGQHIVGIYAAIILTIAVRIYTRMPYYLRK